MATSAQLTRKYGADCLDLHLCFSGNVSDPKKVVEIIAHKSTEELKLILQSYQALYNQDLLHLLSQKSNLLARLVYLRASEPHERDAELIRGAVFGKSLDADTLTEIICTRSSSELRTAKEAYRARYSSNLEKDISGKTNGSLKEVLLALLSSSSYDRTRADASMAMCDAKTLYEAIESGKYIDQKSILAVLSRRNTSQIKAILSSYKQLYGHELMKFLKKDKCGEFGKQLRIVIRCIQSPEKQFAKQLRSALKYGDAQDALLRTVVTRSEIDIKYINDAFKAKTGWSLESLTGNEFSSSSTSGSGALNSMVSDVLTALLKHS